MLEILGFSKQFNGKTVIDDFSLSLGSGSFTVLIGPSGCGKSTLFDLLMGSLPRDGGRLLLHGREIPDLGTFAAYMNQKDLLLPWMSLLDNALLPVAVKRKPSAEDRKEACGLFGDLGLSGYEGHFPGEVSGGMAQRCALARTLMFHAPLVLLDEPLSAVDAITRQSLRDLLLLLQEKFGETMLMITHDVDDALLLADRIILLSPSPLSVKEVVELASGKPRDGLGSELLSLKRRILSRLREGER